MRTPFRAWPLPAAAVLVAAATAAAQDPGPPRFFPNQVSPPRAGVRVDANGFAGPAPTYYPPPAMAPPYAVNARQQAQGSGGGPPRPGTAVMAGPDGVQPAGGFDPAPPRPAPPTIQPVPTKGTLPPPVVSVESTAPEPQPLGPPADGPPPPALPPAGPAEAYRTPRLDPPPAAPAAYPVYRADPGPAAPAIPAEPLLPSRQTPGVVVEMQAPEAVRLGLPLEYVLVVRNEGATPVGNVRVEDDLPAGATLISSEPRAETTGNRLAWNVGAIEPRADRRIRVTVKPAEEGDLRSRATVSYTSAVDTRVRVTRPRLKLALSMPETARVGDRVPVELRVENTGTGPAGRVALLVKFSAGLAHVNGQEIEAALTEFPAGQTKTIRLEANGEVAVSALRAGAQTCVVTGVADGNPAVTCNGTVSVVEPLLEIAQGGPAKCWVRGEPVYAIDLRNPGTAPTDPVTVTTAVPAGFEFVAATDGGEFFPAARTVCWRLPPVGVGEGKRVGLKLKAVAPADGVLTTTATAGPGDPADAGPGVAPAGLRSGGRPLSAKAETAVRAHGVAALRFELTAGDPLVEVGKETYYDIRVQNLGTGACTNVQVQCDLADGVVPVEAGGKAFVGRPVGQRIVFDPVPQIGPKDEKTFRVKVRGTREGDARFRVRMTCDQSPAPVVKEENTRFVKD